MTVSTSTNSVVYRGNGATTEFAVPFKVLDADHLVVTRRDYVTGVVDYTYVGTDYTFSGIGDDEGTLELDGTALDDDYELVIERVVPYTQDLDIVNAGGFYPETVEGQLDTIVMGLQQVASLAGRSAYVPVGEPGMALPKAADRAGKYFAFDAEGDFTGASGSGADSALRTDLAADDGDTLIGTTQDIPSPTTRSVNKVIRDRPWMLEDKGGGPSKTATENTAAATAVLAQFDVTTERGLLQFAKGEYSFLTEMKAPTFARNLTFRGEEGAGNTILKVTDNNKHIIELPTGLNINVLVEFLTLQGTNAAGSSCGLYQPAGGANASYGIVIRHVWARQFGDSGIALYSAFDSALDHVDIDDCKKHGFVCGGNSMSLNHVYAHTTADGFAGLRIFAGTAHLTACLGVDAGETFLRAGRSTLEANDLPLYNAGVNNNESATIILDGCNVEDFELFGVDSWNGNVISRATPYLAAANAVDAVAIRTRPGLNMGYLDNMNVFDLKTPAGNWKEGVPVHSVSGNPFHYVGAAFDVNELEFWDETTAALATCCADGTFESALNTYGRFLNALKVGSFVDVVDEYRVDNVKVIGSRGAALAADATDLATAITLVNQIKARLKVTGGHGLVAD